MPPATPDPAVMEEVSWSWSLDEIAGSAEVHDAWQNAFPAWSWREEIPFLEDPLNYGEGSLLHESVENFAAESVAFRIELGVGYTGGISIVPAVPVGEIPESEIALLEQFIERIADRIDVAIFSTSEKIVTHVYGNETPPVERNVEDLGQVEPSVRRGEGQRHYSNDERLAEFAGAWAVLRAQQEALTKQEYELVRSANEDGLSWRRLGEIIGVSGSAVYVKYDPGGKARKLEQNRQYHRRRIAKGASRD